MRYKVLLCSVLLMLLLCSCGEQEVIIPEQTPKPMHVQEDSTTWDGKLISGISPVSAFDTSASELKIFPYFNSGDYILVKRIYLSDNQFWSSVSHAYIGTPNYVDKNAYSYFTLESGTTIGWVLITEDECYVVQTNTLASAYVEKVCELLCQ